MILLINKKFCRIFADDMMPVISQKQFSRLAKKLKIHICAGLTEKCNKTKKNYNAAILINDEGEIILKYRKINVLEKIINDNKTNLLKNLYISQSNLTPKNIE